MVNHRVECRGCDGTGEGHNGRVCSGCRGRGTVVLTIEHDGSLCPMEGEELPPTADEILAADPTFAAVCDLRNARYLAHAMGAALSEAA